jgi:hypothetical protein
MISKITRYLPFILIIGLAIFWFGKTLVLPPGKMIYGGDIYDAYFYWKGYLYDSLREGFIPFWNPYNFSGTPFLAHPNINIFYPPNWLFAIFPPNISFSYYFFFHIIIASFSMYYLVCGYTDRWGALAAGIIYAFSGFFAARIYSGHLEYVDAASWVPLVIALSRNFINKNTVKNFVLTAIGFSLLILCGNELFLLFSLIFVFSYLGYHFISNLKLRKIKKGILLFFLLLTALCFGFGITAVEVIPRLQFISLSLRSQGVPYNMAGSGSLPIDGLKLFLDPYYWGNPFPENYTYKGLWPNMFEYTHFIGLIPLLLITLLFLFIFLSLLFKKLKENKHSKDVWFFLLIIPVFLIISFGLYINPNFHELLWKFTPLYKGIRFPARHLFGVMLSLCVLAGFSFSFIRNKIIKGIFIALIIFELFSFNRTYIRVTDYPTSTYDQKLVSYLKKDGDLFRLLPDYPVVAGARRDFDFGASINNKIYSTSDYNSMILWRYYHFIDIANKAPVSSILNYNVEIPPMYPWSPFVDYLNVKYVVSDKWGNFIGSATFDKFLEVLAGDRYVLYKNAKVNPRFNLVNEIKIYNDEHNLEKALKEENLDLSKTVLYNRQDKSIYNKDLIKCPEGINGGVKIVSYFPNRIRLSTDATCDSILTTSEIFYPGWNAKIDGVSVPVYLSNSAFRSLYVPKGIHTIEMYYSPEIYYLGGVISLISIAVILFLYFKLRLIHEK